MFNVTMFVASVVVLSLAFCIYLCIEIITRHQWLPARIAAVLVAIVSASAIFAVITGV